MKKLLSSTLRLDTIDIILELLSFLIFLQEIPAEKEFVCAVNLAEINRKLGIVMWSPS